jgi:hypothetical protein
MYVVHELGSAVALCEADQKTEAVAAFDAGVAYYVGSLEGEKGFLLSPHSEGRLMLDVANRLCIEFKACGPEGGLRYGTAQANQLLLAELRNAQEALRVGSCASVGPYLARVVELMTVPLVQGAIKAAFKQSAWWPKLGAAEGAEGEKDNGVCGGGVMGGPARGVLQLGSSPGLKE